MSDLLAGFVLRSLALLPRLPYCHRVTAATAHHPLPHFVTTTCAKANATGRGIIERCVYMLRLR
eukprot:scaffold759_cov119-Isochrysis_galbana.AAC.17